MLSPAQTFNLAATLDEGGDMKQTLVNLTDAQLAEVVAVCIHGTTNKPMLECQSKAHQMARGELLDALSAMARPGADFRAGLRQLGIGAP